jgi:hypothetical protein
MSPHGAVLSPPLPPKPGEGGLGAWRRLQEAERERIRWGLILVLILIILTSRRSGEAPPPPPPRPLSPRPSSTPPCGPFLEDRPP